MSNPLDLSKLNVNRFIKDIEKTVLNDVKGEKIEVECPHCYQEISISPGIGVAHWGASFLVVAYT